MKIRFYKNCRGLVQNFTSWLVAFQAPALYLRKTTKQISATTVIPVKTKIIFTGGGTAGHVTPNLALIAELVKDDSIVIEYIGSQNGVERKLVTAAGIVYHAICCGKLRRYWSVKNFLDPINILIGIGQSLYLLWRSKATIVWFYRNCQGLIRYFTKVKRRSLEGDEPWSKTTNQTTATPVETIIFSKGGFVAFPVVFAAWILRIPVIAHESDFTPGLANRLSFPFVKKICVTFAAAKTKFKQPQKVVITGTPIRSTLFHGSYTRGLTYCNFVEHKPCLLIMGGGHGSTVINACVRQALPQLLCKYQIIHLCGPGQLDQTIRDTGYIQIEYADEILGDLLAVSDVVISRAGANSLYELLALEKPHILIPLSRRVSRGDQLENAAYFAKQNISTVILEENLTVETLIHAIAVVMADTALIKTRIKSLNIHSATECIIALIKSEVYTRYRSF